MTDKAAQAWAQAFAGAVARGDYRAAETLAQIAFEKADQDVREDA